MNIQKTLLATNIALSEYNYKLQKKLEEQDQRVLILYNDDIYFYPREYFYDHGMKRMCGMRGIEDYFCYYMNNNHSDGIKFGTQQGVVIKEILNMSFIHIAYTLLKEMKIEPYDIYTNGDTLVEYIKSRLPFTGSLMLYLKYHCLR